jgi:site-specific recombinase XerD
MARARSFPVTDPELDAPDGAVVDGYERHRDRWVLAKVAETPSPLALRASEEHNARLQVEQSAPNTLKAYASDWKAFTAWCRARVMDPANAPGDRVAVYLSDMHLAGRKLASIERALSSIAHGQKPLAPREDPAVRATMKGLRQAFKGAPVTRKSPAVIDVLKRMVEGLGDDDAGRRDRALLTLGFAGAFRRSELVALDRADLVFQPEGLIVRVRQSKTGARVVAIPYFSDPSICPIRSLQRYLDRLQETFAEVLFYSVRIRAAVDVSEGPIFRSLTRNSAHWGARITPQVVARLVKTRAKAAGLDAKLYSGHSLRAGFATSAALAGKEQRDIMRQTGHKSAAMLERYVREIGLFERNAAAGLA